MELIILASRSDGVGTMTKDLKSIICAFYDADFQVLRESPSTVFLHRTFDDEQLEVLRKTAGFLMTTDFFNEQTRYYLSHYSATYKDVAKDLNINFNTVKSNVWHCVSKLEKNISKASLRAFMGTGNKKAFNDFKRDINELIRKYDRKDDLAKNIIINIPKGDKIASRISDEQFEEFLITVKPYIKKFVDVAKASISEEMASYFWYLHDYEGNLEDIDSERVKRLRDLMCDN